MGKHIKRSLIVIWDRKILAKILILLHKIIVGGVMDSFKIEYLIADDKEKSVKISSLNKKEMIQWRRDMEARALSKYYKRKIEIKDLIL